MTEDEAIEIASAYMVNKGHMLANFEISAYLVSKDDVANVLNRPEDEWIVCFNLIMLKDIDPICSYLRVNCQTKVVTAVPVL